MKKIFRNIEFELNPVHGAATYFVFGVRKCGSSITNNMVNALAMAGGRQFIDIPGRMFDAGHRESSWGADPLVPDLIEPGLVYGGFRSFPDALRGHAKVLDAQSVLLVRDPRDALVSEYYSNAYSHSIPVEGATRNDMERSRAAALTTAINDYVVAHAPALKETFRGVEWLSSIDSCWVVRYEEAIMDKRWFMRELCTRWNWRVDDQLISQILGWADVRPEKESPESFVRKVTPGDHKEKLPRETIDRLNSVFEHELMLYGYVN